MGNIFLVGLLLVVVSILLDILFCIKWNKVYFTKGIKIYNIKIPNDKNSEVFKRIADNPNFKQDVFEKMHIHKISNNQIAFKENGYWNYIFSFHYPTIMNGLIEINETSGIIQIKGIMKYSSIAFILYWYLIIIIGMIILNSFKNIGDFLLFTILPMFFYGFVYIAQISTFKKLGQYFKHN